MLVIKKILFCTQIQAQKNCEVELSRHWRGGQLVEAGESVRGGMVEHPAPTYNYYDKGFAPPTLLCCEALGIGFLRAIWKTAGNNFQTRNIKFLCRIDVQLRPENESKTMNKLCTTTALCDLFMPSQLWYKLCNRIIYRVYLWKIILLNSFL